jgi:hypothetical protein
MPSVTQGMWVTTEVLGWGFVHMLSVTQGMWVTTEVLGDEIKN